MNFTTLVRVSLKTKKLLEKFEKQTTGKNWHNQEIALGLLTDLGDLSRIILAKEGFRTIPGDVNKALKHELADCLWSIIILADKYNIDLPSALNEMCMSLTKKLKNMTPIAHYDNYVVIIPLLPKGNILLQKQYKHGAGKICFGFPAGFIKPRENPLQAAKRELFEETGYTATKWQKIGMYYDNASVSNIHFTIFLATNTSQKNAQLKNPDNTESMIVNQITPLKKLGKIKMEGSCMALAQNLMINLSQIMPEHPNTTHQKQTRK